MSEVEAQAFGRYEGALLHRLGPQHRAQRRVKQMGPRVISHRCVPGLGVDNEIDRIVESQLPIAHHPSVHE